MANYFIVENNKQAGPFSLEQLAAKGITPETNVWTDGMANWTPASQVSELQFLFAPQTPPIPQTPEPEPAPAYEQPLYEQPSYNSNSYQSQPEDTNTDGSSDYVPMPKDYKMQSIILIAVSVFCCGLCAGIVNLALGVMALLENNKVEPAYHAGNYELAQAASDKAGKYTKIGFIVFGVGIVLEIIFFIIYIIIGIANS